MSRIKIKSLICELGLTNYYIFPWLYNISVAREYNSTIKSNIFNKNLNLCNEKNFRNIRNH